MKNKIININPVKGFTLLELLIAVAIVAILTSIALPSYSQYVREARRTDAIDAVMSCASDLKKRFTITNSFIGDLPDRSLCNGTSSEGYYDMSFQSDATTFTITATPANDSTQTRDLDCLAFTFTNTSLQGVKGAKEGSPDECWR